MSRFISSRLAGVTPYTPGEQPKDCKYIKLNTNESPYPPSAAVMEAVREESGLLRLYSDPECSRFTASLAGLYGLRPEQIIAGNGSDEILEFAFMAFADRSRPLAFPDITYGFYPVLADINHIPYTEIPLRADYTIDTADYAGLGSRVIVIANPNAPTGLCLAPAEIEKLLKAAPDSLVIVDEAYVDFGGESAVALVERYDNLLVTQTFSKSRSMAGARLGFAVGNEALIRDMNTIKYSINPYNVNRMTEAAGCAALADNAYYMENCRRIAETREKTAAALKALGFQVLPSKANFLFASSACIDGGELYLALKARGILVRHFEKPRISQFVRITIGTKEQMEALVSAVAQILKEREK